MAGGLRQGGNSYYALDITDPGAAGYPGYMWEFPKEGSAATLVNSMGETWGTPIMTKVKVVISGVAYERWVAIVTGGYHASGDPNDPVNYNAAATPGPIDLRDRHEDRRACWRRRSSTPLRPPAIRRARCSTRCRRRRRCSISTATSSPT